MPFAMPLRRDLAGLRIDRAGVALAEMDAERDAIETGDHRIVGCNRALEIALGVLPARAHAVERYLIDISGVAGRVDLDVAAAGLDQLADDAASDHDHVRHEGIHVAVEGLRG